MKKKPYIVYMAEKGGKMVAFGFIPKGNTFEKIALQGEPSQKKHLIEATTRGFNLWKKWGGADKEYESLLFDPWIQGIKSSPYPIVNVSWEREERLK